MTQERQLIYAARVISMVFTPFYLPIVGLALLFVFSYFNTLPWSFMAEVLLLVYFFTVLLPTFLIRAYRRYQGWSLLELGQQERRMVPYIISILCYFVCVYIMEYLRMPHFLASIVNAALLVQMVCAIVNLWWKVSTHIAALGGVAGSLFVFAELFGFNPVWWLCLVFILAGILGTSRMILRQHSLSQVTGGFLIGFFCAVIGILFL